MISFNGSQFDDLFLLQSAVEREETVYATFAGRSMLGLQTSRFVCWDLKKYLV